jgi:hypothetical protein
MSRTRAAIARIALFASLAGVAELFGQLQQPHLGADNLLVLCYVGMLSNAEACDTVCPIRLNFYRCAPHQPNTVSRALFFVYFDPAKLPNLDMAKLRLLFEGRDAPRSHARSKESRRDANAANASYL